MPSILHHWSLPWHWCVMITDQPRCFQLLHLNLAMHSLDRWIRHHLPSKWQMLTSDPPLICIFFAWWSWCIKTHSVIIGHDWHEEVRSGKEAVIFPSFMRMLVDQISSNLSSLDCINYSQAVDGRLPLCICWALLSTRTFKLPGRSHTSRWNIMHWLGKIPFVS